MEWRDNPFIVNLVDCAEFASYTSLFLTVTLTPMVLIVMCLYGVFFGG